MRRLLAVYITVVVGTSTSLALFSGLDTPFLRDSDRDTICEAALHYRPPAGSRSDAASHTATSTATAAIRTNDSSYRPGQPLLG